MSGVDPWQLALSTLPLDDIIQNSLEHLSSVYSCLLFRLLFGSVHRTEPLIALSEAIRAFVTIPAKRRLSSAANKSLITTLTEGEGLQAIAKLIRHKISGTDGLNNDF